MGRAAWWGREDMNEDDVGNIAGNDVMLLAVFKRSHTLGCAI